MSVFGVRARPCGILSPLTGLPLFKLVSPGGDIVARIHDARSAPEALRLYWRRRAGTATSTALGARIEDRQGRSLTMARPHNKSARPPQLPLEGGTVPEARPRDPRRKPRDTGRDISQTDLFAATPAPVRPSATAAAPLEAVPLPPEPVRHLQASEAPLARIHYRGLREGDPDDNYLYHVTTDAEATSMMNDGLSFSPESPLPLTERGGVPYWLANLVDEDDPAPDVVVLRIKRYLVEDLVEIDPDASRSVGAKCYFLTGSQK